MSGTGLLICSHLSPIATPNPHFRKRSRLHENCPQQPGVLSMMSTLSRRCFDCLVTRKVVAFCQQHTRERKCLTTCRYLRLSHSRSRASQESCSITKKSRVSDLHVPPTSTSLRARRIPRAVFFRQSLYPHPLPRRCVGGHQVTSLKARKCWIHELTCKARPRKCFTGYAAT